MIRKLLIILILLIQIVYTVTRKCPESASTRKVVNTCPRNLKEYKKRAKERSCESISNSCDSFVYHCVPDTYLTLLQEICAPKTVIVGRKCAEWNIGGQSIQSSKNSRGLCSKFESNPCPEVYISTDLYKYPGCYNLIQKKSHEETTTIPTKATPNGKDIPQPESNSIWIIPVIIIAVIVVIAVLVITFIVVKWRGCNRCCDNQCTQCRKGKKTDNGVYTEEEGLLNNGIQEHSNHEINKDVDLQSLANGKRTEMNENVHLSRIDDSEEKGKIEVSLQDIQEVDVDKNRQNKAFHDKSRKKRGRKRVQSESSATESEQINKYDEYQKLIEEASHLRGGQRSNKVIRNSRRLSNVEEEDTYSIKMILSSLDTYEKAQAYHSECCRRKRRITA